MPDPVVPVPVPPERDPPTILQRIFSAGPQGVMQAAGLFFTLVAVISFIYGIVRLISGSVTMVGRDAPFDFWRDLFLPKFDIFAIMLIGIIAALFAIRLFTKAGSLSSQVIRPEDRALLDPLIRDAKKEAINEYIRLASLTGFVGTFTKLGFTGLPLVTVALTLILLVISLLLHRDPDMQKSVFDMAKLMLGAFVGSFVQRNVEQERLFAGSSPAVIVTPGGGGSGGGDGGGAGAAGQRVATGAGSAGPSSTATGSPEEQDTARG
jgi:hypothetical protein